MCIRDRNDNGGALGADGKVVELKRAYIDWMVPQTDLKVRMGIQGIALPSFTTNASQIMDDDVAAISLNYQFNENVGLTAFWARPYNDNAGYYKNSDFGGTPVSYTHLDVYKRQVLSGYRACTSASVATPPAAMTGTVEVSARWRRAVRLTPHCMPSRSISV